MNIKSKARKALPYSMGISVVNILVALFGMVLLVRHLDATEYGVYALLSALPTLFNMLFALGYDQYLIRYIPGVDDAQTLRNTVWNIILRRTLLIVLVSLALVAGFQGYARYFGLEGYFPHLSTYLIIVVMFTAYELLKKVLLAKFSQRVVLFNNILYHGGRISVIVYGVAQQARLMFFIEGFVLVQLLSVSLLSLYFLKHYGLPSLSRVIGARQESKEEQQYRWGSYIDKLGSSFLGTDIDRYVLAYFSTNLQVAIYAVATKTLSKLVDLYPNRMFQHVIQPAVYARFDEGQSTAQLDEAFQFLYSANNIIGFLMMAIFFPLGQSLLLLVFEQEYVLQAYWPLLIFLGFLVLYNVPLELVAKSIKKPKILVYSKLALFFNIGVGIPLAHYHGALGMAIATASSGALRNVIVYVLINRHVALRIPWRATIRSVVNAVLTVLVVMLLQAIVAEWVLVKALIGTCVYLGLTKYHPVFTPREITLLRSLVPRRFRKLATVLT